MTSRRSTCFQEILIEDYYSNYHQDQNNWTQLYELMDVVKYHRPITFHRIYLVFLCIGGSRGGVRDARPPLGVQILSISCSFRENLACSRPPWRVHAPPSGKSWIRHCSGNLIHPRNNNIHRIFI